VADSVLPFSLVYPPVLIIFIFYFIYLLLSIILHLYTPYGAKPVSYFTRESYIILYYITLHYITLHYIILYYITLYHVWFDSRGDKGVFLCLRTCMHVCVSLCV
jgi:hypothetical protein